MRFTTTGAAAVALLVSIAPAGAQMVTGISDMSGFYVGANMGGSFGYSTATITNTTGGTFTTSQHLDSGGFQGGGQAGYNFRLSPNWLLGVEADFDGTGYSSNSGTQVRTKGGLTATYNVSRGQDWLGTVRARLGYNWSPNTLLYLTGGLAYAEAHASLSNQFSGTSTANFAGSKSGTVTGWTIGHGVEYSVTPQISLFGQYMYVDLGSLSYGANIKNAAAAAVVSTAKTNITVDNQEHIFRVGINYHFGAPPPPPPAPMAAPAPPPAAAKVFIVFFDWDKDTITPEGQAIIQQAADAYKAGAPVQIQVTGYTDRSGSPGYNQRLSERRANNVARALAALGVPKTQMAVSGRGENDNRVPTAPGVREPQNRRVEIVAP